MVDSALPGISRLKMWKYAPYLVILTVVAGLHAMGAFWATDRLVMDASFRLFDRNASGHLTIVEFDPRSLKEVGVWPWPRSIHADTISRLMDAGAIEIGIDVDFSSASTPDMDARLADVLKAANTKVILPAFRQRATTRDGEMAMHETIPLDAFAEHVQIGGVNFRPSPDGLIRTAEVISSWRGADLPAMSTLLAGPAALDKNRFYLDYGIRPDSIPRISVIDLLNGDVAAERIKGKKFLVGAGATELGDQHAVPVYSRMYGVEVQAMAFESLVQDRTMTMAPAMVVAFVLTVFSLVLGTRLEPLHWRTSAAIGVGLGAGSLVGSIILQGVATVILPASALVALVVATVIHSNYRDLWTLAVITFRQRMSLSHQGALLQEILDTSFDGVVVTDATGRIFSHNDSAVRLLRAGHTNLVGTTFGSLIPDTDALVPIASTEQAKEAPRTPTVVIFDTERHDPYHLEFFRGYFVRDVSREDPSERRTVDRVFTTYTFRDVTAREMQEAVRRAETERAIKMSRAKSEAIATMSHELRTPLNAIIGFSEIMRMGSLGPLPAVYQSYANDINDSGAHLLSLVEDMLDISTIEEGGYVLHETVFDVSAAVRDTTRMLSGEVQSGGNELTLNIEPGLPLIRADERLVKQCISNLVSNSIKYGAPQTPISITVRRSGRGDLVIEVEDTGPGLSNEQLKHVRKPFYRVGKASIVNEQSGVGLGLALVDVYVKSHGGAFEITSRVDFGTTARLVFPRKRFVESAKTDTTDGRNQPSNVIGFKKS